MSNEFDFNKPLTAELKELILEEVKFRGNSRVPRYVIENIKFDNYIDLYTDSLVVAVELAIGAIKDSKTTKTEPKTNTKDLQKYPSTLWDYFKEKYSPKWFIDKYPVKYIEYFQSVTHITENTTNIMKVFPDIALDNRYQIIRAYEMDVTK